MTLKDKIENLEALHAVQKRNLANTQLWLVFVSFHVPARYWYDSRLWQATNAN